MLYKIKLNPHIELYFKSFRSSLKFHTLWVPLYKYLELLNYIEDEALCCYSLNRNIHQNLYFQLLQSKPNIPTIFSNYIQRVPYHIGLSPRFRAKNMNIKLKNLVFSCRKLLHWPLYIILKLLIN